MRWLYVSLVLLLASACDGTGTPIAGLDASVAGDRVDPAPDLGVAPDATAALDATGPAEDAGFGQYYWWQDVEPIVSTKCQLCHADPPQFTAPRPLVTYRHTQVRTGLGAPVHEEMVKRIYAPRMRMPPPSQPQLTEAEREIIRVWSANGAPEGTPPVRDDAGVADGSAADAAPAPTDGAVAPADAGPAPTDGGGVVMDAGTAPGRSFDVTASRPGGAGPYELPVRDTNYSCWSFTVPPGGGDDEHIVRFEHIIDNTVNLHHMLLFVNRDADSDPGPFGCGSFPLTWDMISGWAPGRQPEVLPMDVGVPVEPGMQLVLQVHYDDVRMGGVTDGSGIRVITVDQPGMTSAGIMWAGGVWIGGINGANVRRRGSCTIRTPITIFQNFPHMHELGLRITLELQRGGSGPWDTISEVPAWDFEDQPNIDIPQAAQQLDVGDKLRTTCWWDTMGRNVNFGDATSDEMCFNFIYHFPLLSNPTLACASILR